jgi:hypothetical protein
MKAITAAQVFGPMPLMSSKRRSNSLSGPWPCQCRCSPLAAHRLRLHEQRSSYPILARCEVRSGNCSGLATNASACAPNCFGTSSRLKGLPGCTRSRETTAGYANLAAQHCGFVDDAAGTAPAGLPWTAAAPLPNAPAFAHKLHHHAST